MLRKTFTLTTPLDMMVYPLDLFLTDVAANALQSASGSYTGNGVSGLKITTPFFPKLIIISPKINTSTSATTIAGNMVFSFSANPGASWLPGTGFKKDCVLTCVNDGFTLGTNTNVNAPTVVYLYFMVG